MGPAAEGPLTKGDALETGADGSASVRFADGRTVEVGPEARFVLDEDASGMVLKVARGIFLSRVPATPKGRTGGSGSSCASLLRTASRAWAARRPAR